MADFSKVVEYEKPHSIHIPDPRTGEPSGIVINVISQESERVVSALRDHQSKQWAREAAGETIDLTEAVAERTRIILIESIDSWSWGEHSFEHINDDAPCDRAAKEFLVDHKNAQWLINQIEVGISNLRNFMQELPKSVRSPSKKK